MSRLLYIILLVILSLEVYAQDPKFSQYFASPLTLNPALAGYFDGYYRFALNTRRQWANVGDPYSTTSISGEYKFNDEYYYNGIFSVGANLLFEESFNKALKANVVNVGFSYYQFFDADHKVKFGLAPQLSYISKSLDFNALTFASQYVDGIFDPSRPSYLESDRNAINYLDFNIGANFALALEYFNLSLGYSLFHLVNPQESLDNHYLGKVPLRQTTTFSFQYMSNDLIDINISAHHMKQRRSEDNILGIVFGFKPTYDSKFKLNLGLWHKFNEKSFFPYFGFDISNYSVGINHTISSNKINNIQPKTFELSFIMRDKRYVKFKNTCKF